ncbi:MAG: HIT domain-containing protein [Thermoguttaceae bacterium]|mgnify:CR=1 FL=1|jgi:ATP adenylyltransferase|nr:HIT domain-containing protein [Thermoguttaceae bacterium]
MSNDILWAPWRMPYIKSEEQEEQRKVEVGAGADPDCFICQGVADSTEFDRERLIVGRTETTIAILNRFPYNNGHLLIAPKRHIARMDEMTPEEGRDTMAELSYWVCAIEKSMNAEGFNVGVNLGRVAGAGLPGHMHWHIVPRWSGDVNYFTTIGSAKAIPQALEAAWEMLRRE